MTLLEEGMNKLSEMILAGKEARSLLIDAASYAAQENDARTSEWCSQAAGSLSGIMDVVNRWHPPVEKRYRLKGEVRAIPNETTEVYTIMEPTGGIHLTMEVFERLFEEV